MPCGNLKVFAFCPLPVEKGSILAALKIAFILRFEFSIQLKVGR